MKKKIIPELLCIFWACNLAVATVTTKHAFVDAAAATTTTAEEEKDVTDRELQDSLFLSCVVDQGAWSTCVAGNSLSLSADCNVFGLQQACPDFYNGGDDVCDAFCNGFDCLNVNCPACSTQFDTWRACADEAEENICDCDGGSTPAPSPTETGSPTFSQSPTESGFDFPLLFCIQDQIAWNVCLGGKLVTGADDCNATNIQDICPDFYDATDACASYCNGFDCLRASCLGCSAEFDSWRTCSIDSPQNICDCEGGTSDNGDAPTPTPGSGNGQDNDFNNDNSLFPSCIGEQGTWSLCVISNTINPDANCNVAGVRNACPDFYNEDDACTAYCNGFDCLNENCLACSSDFEAWRTCAATSSANICDCDALGVDDGNTTDAPASTPDGDNDSDNGLNLGDSLFPSCIGEQGAWSLCVAGNSLNPNANCSVFGLQDACPDFYEAGDACTAYCNGFDCLNENCPLCSSAFDTWQSCAANSSESICDCQGVGVDDGNNTNSPTPTPDEANGDDDTDNGFNLGDSLFPSCIGEQGAWSLCVAGNSLNPNANCSVFGLQDACPDFYDTDDACTAYCNGFDCLNENCPVCSSAFDAWQSCAANSSESLCDCQGVGVDDGNDTDESTPTPDATTDPNNGFNLGDSLFPSCIGEQGAWSLCVAGNSLNPNANCSVFGLQAVCPDFYEAGDACTAYCNGFDCLSENCLTCSSAFDAWQSCAANSSESLCDCQGVGVSDGNNTDESTPNPDADNGQGNDANTDDENDTDANTPAPSPDSNNGDDIGNNNGNFGAVGANGNLICEDDNKAWLQCFFAAQLDPGSECLRDLETSCADFLRSENNNCDAFCDGFDCLINSSCPECSDELQAWKDCIETEQTECTCSGVGGKFLMASAMFATLLSILFGFGW